MKNKSLNLSYKVEHVKILSLRFTILVLCAKVSDLCAEFKFYVPKSVIYVPILSFMRQKQSFMCQSEILENLILMPAESESETAAEYL